MIGTIKLYLDSSDLINIAEGEKPFGLKELELLLRQGGAVLALSVATISEVSAPLANPRSSTNVMRLLTRLEALPHVFIADARIQRLELESALRLLRTGQASNVSPFTDRYDDAVHVNAAAPTRIYIRYSMAEAVYDTWRADSSALWQDPRFHSLLSERVQEDRQESAPPKPKVHFGEVLSRQLSLFGLSVDLDEVSELSALLRRSPAICPSYTLSHAMFALLRQNRTDIVKEGDLLDLVHASCLPYVEYATMDRRMRAYVTQACARLKFDFDKRVLSNVQCIATRLAGRVEENNLAT